MTTTLLIASLVTTAVGAGVQYSAAKKQAKAQEAAADYNARVIQNQAKHEGDVAAENARRGAEVKRRRLANIRAHRAGAGVTFTGSVVDQLEDSAFLMERDIQDAVYQNQTKQGRLRSQASNTIWAGKQKAAGTRASANANLLMGVADIGKQIYGGFDSGSAIPS